MSIHMEKNSKKISIYLNFKKLILKNVTFFKKNKPKIVFFKTNASIKHKPSYFIKTVFLKKKLKQTDPNKYL